MTHEIAYQNQVFTDKYGNTIQVGVELSNHIQNELKNNIVVERHEQLGIISKYDLFIPFELLNDEFFEKCEII
jgi:hypothetical protein